MIVGSLSGVGCGDRPEGRDGISNTGAPLDVVEATIADLHEAINSGRATCREIVQAYLNRIAAYDKPSGLHTITVVNPMALERADEIDETLRAGGVLGPLFCAPILVKDNFDTHDLPTTGGSIVLKDSHPPDDAYMVRQIRQADAIVIAKTNMAEWAFSPRRTESSSFGVTANAYAVDRVPAGSSGGTASGVAASFGVAGLGSDTGNSIRGPSSHLALFGIRSTIGLTSRDGIIPLAFDRDIAGPMTRTVTEGALLFDVVAGYDPNDPYTEDGRGRREADYTSFLDPDGLRGARIGVLRTLVDTEDADPEVITLFESAIEDLKRAGAEIIDPFEVDTLDAHISADTFCARFRYDMYVYLGSLGDAAPIRDVMEVYETGQYSPYIKEDLEYYGAHPLDRPPETWDEPCPPYLKHPGRMAYLDDMVTAMDAADVEALIYPTWTNPPAHLDRPSEEYKGDNSQLVAPATGMPAVTVPMGYTYGTLPAGLQILGRPYSEGALIRFAYAYEQATRHRRPPAGFPALPGIPEKVDSLSTRPGGPSSRISPRAEPSSGPA
jgi:Asp-tRNA(Asn)/Glu-tRNA(Gln) amidotransferase A subunit family amidase